MKKIFVLVIIMIMPLMISQVAFAGTDADSSEIEFIFPFGDINWDKQVNSVDALEVLKYSARILPVTYRQIAIADINDDTVLSSDDALVVLQKAARIIDEIPCNLKDISLPDNRYFTENLDFIEDFIENNLKQNEGKFKVYNINNTLLDIGQENEGITRLSICDVYKGGKPELILIDTEDSLNTYIISEDNGELKINICSTTMIEEQIYIGNDTELYGIAKSHIMGENPVETMNLFYAKYIIEEYVYVIPAAKVNLNRTIEVNHGRGVHVSFDIPDLHPYLDVAIDGSWRGGIYDYDFYGVEENHQVVISYSGFIGWHPQGDELRTTFNALLILEEQQKNK